MVKFLVIRFSSIGDIVLTTPVVRGLKNQVEDASVHYLTKAAFAPILEANPFISKVFKYDNNLPELLKLLKAENYDYVIDLHHNIRSLRIKNALRRMAYSFNKLNIRKWVYVNLKQDVLPDKHIVDRYLETTKIFSVENDGRGLDFFIPEAEQVKPEILFNNTRLPYVVLVVGGGHQTKQLPTESIITLCKRIEYPIVLLGGKADVQKSKAIKEQVNSPQLVNKVGTLSLNASASVVQKASLVITPDTGLMHIAAAFGKTIFSVWGNTVPKFGMYPYQPGENSELFEVQGLSCRPCSKIGYTSCPKKHFRCMRDQPLEQIIQKANTILNKSK